MRRSLVVVVVICLVAACGVVDLAREATRRPSLGEAVGFYLPRLATALGADQRLAALHIQATGAEAYRPDGRGVAITGTTVRSVTAAAAAATAAGVPLPALDPAGALATAVPLAAAEGCPALERISLDVAPSGAVIALARCTEPARSVQLGPDGVYRDLDLTSGAGITGAAREVLTLLPRDATITALFLGPAPDGSGAILDVTVAPPCGAGCAEVRLTRRATAAGGTLMVVTTTPTAGGPLSAPVSDADPDRLAAVYLGTLHKCGLVAFVSLVSEDGRVLTQGDAGGCTFRMDATGAVV